MKNGTFAPEEQMFHFQNVLKTIEMLKIFFSKNI